MHRADTELNCDSVHALLAQGLVRPALMREALDGAAGGASPAARLAQMLPPEGLAQLVRFRGFITKIKLNALHRILPRTLRVLRMSEQEINLYAAGSEGYVALRDRGPLSLVAQIDFLRSQISRFQGRCGWIDLAAAMLEHESALWMVMQPRNGPVDTSAVRLHPACEVRQHRYDVVAISDTLDEEQLGVAPRETVPRLFVYRGGSAGAEVLQPDAFTAEVLSLVDGFRTADDIGDALVARGLPRDILTVLPAFLDQAADLRLVTLPAQVL